MKYKPLNRHEIEILKRTIKYFNEYYFKLIIAIITILLNIVISVYEPLISGKLIVGLMNRDSKTIFRSIEYLSLFFIIELICNYIYVYLTSYISNNIISKLKVEMYSKILNFSIKVFDKSRTGEFISKIHDDTIVFTNTVMIQLMSAVVDIIRLLAIGFTMIHLSPQLSTVCIFSFPLTYIVFIKYGNLIKAKSIELKKMNDSYFSFIQQSFTGIREIRALNIRKQVYGSFEKLTKSIKEKNINISIFNIKAQSISSVINFISEIFVIILGSILIIRYNFRMEYFIAFLSYSKQFSSSLLNLTELNSSLQQSIVSIERIFEIIDNKKYPYTQYGLLGKEPINGNIEFQNVSFSYNNIDEKICDMSFNIIHGSKVAIVGKSGSGKTTILNLLLRFYEQNRGSIKIDNIDIKDLSEETLRSNITIVRQEPILFNLSIKDNFLLVKPDATQEEIENSCKAAYIHDFIMSLPNKYNTIIEEQGINLSCGQKQRIAMARVLLKGAKIILLDEVTSALDNQSQLFISNTINSYFKNETVIIISHRLETIKNAEQIIVVDSGKIIDIGTHKELIKRNKLYNELCNSTFQES